VIRDIQGQPKAVRILSGTIRKNRIPTSILLSGEIGTGKRFAAINYAKAINCLAPADNDSCDNCISCRKIDSNLHPDVFFVEPDNDEIKIDTIRKLEDNLCLKSFEGRKKIAVVDRADRMNNSAANAFLKTLEEPPDNSIIILMSSNDDGLPDTIKSRCVKINFYPLPLEDCRRIMSNHVSPEDLSLFINLAMGRPGIAGRRNFSEEKAWFFKLYNNMLNYNSKDIWADKEQMGVWLDMSLVLLRDIIVYDITDNESEVLLCIPPKRNSMTKALDAYDNLEQVRSLLGYNLNRQVTWNYVAGVIKNKLF